MRPRPFLLLLAGFALVLMLPAAPAAGEMTVTVNEVEISLDTRDVTLTSGTQIVIRADLTEPQKAGGDGDADIDVARVLVQGKFLDDPGRMALLGFLDDPEEPPDYDYPPDYDRYVMRFPETGPSGYAAEGPYIGEIEFTVTARNESGGNISRQTFWVTIASPHSPPPIATIDSISPSPAEKGSSMDFAGTVSDSNVTAVIYLWESTIDGELSTEANFSISNLSLGYHTIFFRVQYDSTDWPTLEGVVTGTYYRDGWDEECTDENDDGYHDDWECTDTFWCEIDVSYSFTVANRTYLSPELITGSSGESECQTDLEGQYAVNSSVTVHYNPDDPDKNFLNVKTYTDSASLWIYAAPIPNAGVNVEVVPNTEVQFIGSGTDEDGTIVKYEWDLNGDGVYDWASTLNGITTHIYNGEGTYTAVLRLTDDDGITATDSRVITVGDGGGGGDDGGGGIPAPSLAASVAAVAVIALRRPRKP